MAALITPCGMLLASESNPPAAVNPGNANWYDVEQASNLFNRMTANAMGVRSEVAQLQVHGYQLDWRSHSANLAKAKENINNIGDDLQTLNQTKSRLLPWQQHLVDKVTPNAQQMANQTDLAMNTLAQHKDRSALQVTEYPNSIDQIYRNANQMVKTIQNTTHAAQGEQMSALNGTSIMNPGS